MMFCHCFRVSTLFNFSSHQFYPKDVNLGPSHNNLNFRFLIYKPSILTTLVRTLSKRVCGWVSHLVPGPLLGNGPLLGPYPTLKICGCSYLSNFGWFLHWVLHMVHGCELPSHITCCNSLTCTKLRCPIVGLSYSNNILAVFLGGTSKHLLFPILIYLSTWTISV